MVTEEVVGNYCLMSTVYLFGLMKNFRDIDDNCTYCEGN